MVVGLATGGLVHGRVGDCVRLLMAMVVTRVAVMMIRSGFESAEINGAPADPP